LNSKKYEIEFKFDIKRDTPEKIAEEMSHDLMLPDYKIEAIRTQIYA